MNQAQLLFLVILAMSVATVATLINLPEYPLECLNQAYCEEINYE